jgi:NAD(P)-dependent dehydrogenase (short-subunit alcohol dehydrogenase family)
VNRAAFDFTGSAVLVTGGTSGIGNAVARAFRDAGAEVTVTGTRATAADYDTDLDGMTFRLLRTTDRQGVDALARSIDRLDVLVNNAGANFPGGRDEWDPDVFEEALALNLSGAFRLTTGCHDALAASDNDGGASVVNVVSMAAYRAVPIVPGYGSGKAGLLQMTRNLASQWAIDGIRINAVAPGVIETPMTAPMQHLPDLAAQQTAHIPMGRWGRVGEVASAVLFLSSAQASYVTGHALAVDGGYLVF